MSARLKPISIDNAKHIVTAVLKAGPIVLDASSAAVSSSGSTCGGIRLSSSEPSGISSGTIPSPTVIFSFLGVSFFPFPAVDFFSLLVSWAFLLSVFLLSVAGVFFPLSVFGFYLPAVVGFPFTVAVVEFVEFVTVAVLLADSLTVGPRFLLVVGAVGPFPAPPPELPPPPPFFRSLLDSSTVAVYVGLQLM